MLQADVQAAVQRLDRGDQQYQPPAGDQQRTHVAQRAEVVLDVLQNIEADDRVHVVGFQLVRRGLGRVEIMNPEAPVLHEPLPDGVQVVARAISGHHQFLPQQKAGEIAGAGTDQRAPRSGAPPARGKSGSTVHRRKPEQGLFANIEGGQPERTSQ